MWLNMKGQPRAWGRKISNLSETSVLVSDDRVSHNRTFILILCSFFDGTQCSDLWRGTLQSWRRISLFRRKILPLSSGWKDGRTIQLHDRTMELKNSHCPIIRRGLHNILALNHGVSSYHSTDNRSTGSFVHAIGLDGYNEMIIPLNIYVINYRTS
jgi:hypothetical protein